MGETYIKVKGNRCVYMARLVLKEIQLAFILVNQEVKNSQALFEKALATCHSTRVITVDKNLSYFEDLCLR
nr:hypothetical protein [Ectobacillus panaciterrae]